MILDYLSNSNVIDISIIITITSFVLLYFGKIISDSNWRLENKTSNYMLGLFFVFYNILIPLVIIYSFYKFDFKLNILTGSLILIQIVILSIMSKKWVGVKFHKIGLTKKLKKIIDELTLDYMNKLKILPHEDKSTSANSFKNLRLWASNYFLKPPKSFSQFVFSFIVVLSTFIVFIQDVSLVYKLFSLLITFIVLTFVASYYNIKIVKAKLILKDGEKINGTIQKLTENVIVMYVKNKMVVINSDEVKKIEIVMYNERIMSQIKEKLKTKLD